MKTPNTETNAVETVYSTVRSMHKHHAKRENIVATVLDKFQSHDKTKLRGEVYSLLWRFNKAPKGTERTKTTKAKAKTLAKAAAVESAQPQAVPAATSAVVEALPEDVLNERH